MTDRNAIATEWGLPDWQDEATYGDTSNWSFMRWRWEFIRRRDDYRADFDRWKDQTYEFWINVNKLEGSANTDRILKPHQPGFKARIQDGSFKYGYTALPNPRISDQPFTVIFSHFDRDDNISYIEGKGDRFFGDIIKTSAGDGEILVKFDIDKPIKPQLEAVKEILTAYQRYKHGRTLQIRRHPSKWLLYLRFLDGRETGATWSELQSILPRHIEASPQSSRDVHTQAKNLCFNF